MPKEPTNKELDKMIDDSVKDMKKEEEARPAAKGDKKEKPAEPKAGKEKPKAEEQAIRVVEGYDPWKILMYPHLAEKSMNMVEIENKLVFIVKRNATKEQIKDAVEKGFDVKVTGINVIITRKGSKKAYVKLSPDNSAADIATRLGMI